MTAPPTGAMARIRQANKRLPPEDGVALRVAVTVAVLAAGTATLRQDVGGGSLVVAVLAGIPAANVFSHVTRRRDGMLLKAFLAFGILVAFAGFLVSVTRVRTGDITDVQIPLAELFLWTQLLHSMDVPARRDLQFSLVSSLVLMAIGGVLSISMDYALHVVVWAVAALAALVLAHRSELGDMRQVTPRQPPAARPAAVAARRLRPVATALALVFVLATVAFMVVPPAGTARALTFPALLPARVAVGSPGGLANSTLGDDDPAGRSDPGSADSSGRQSFGYFGFSDRLDTAARGRPDRTLVMRVRSAAADFWRGQTFDVWDGRTWTLSDERTVTIRGDRPLNIPPAPTDVPLRGGELVQTFFVERPGPNMIFSAYRPDQLYFPDNVVFQLSDGSLRAGVELAEGAVYTVISHRPRASVERLREVVDATGFPTPPEITRRYLQLPEVPRRVVDLARQVTASAPTVYDKVRALEAWMAENTTYTLDIPRLPRGADAVEQYLFVDRQGFCEQIGTSLVVMLRALGIPARLVVGYAAGERNPFTGLYEVRASDAHSWAEVWFPGIGWQGFDPTASVPLAGDAGPSAAGAGALRFVTTRLPEVPAGAVEALLGAGAVLALATAGFQLWRASDERRRLAARPWATGFVERVEAAGAARGRARQPGQTTAEYVHALAASVLPDGRLRAVADLLDRERYAPAHGRGSEAEHRHAEAVLDDAAARWPPAHRAPVLPRGRR